MRVMVVVHPGSRVGHLKAVERLKYWLLWWTWCTLHRRDTCTHHPPLLLVGSRDLMAGPVEGVVAQVEEHSSGQPGEGVVPGEGHLARWSRSQVIRWSGGQVVT